MLATRRRIVMDRRQSFVDFLKTRNTLMGLWRASAYRNDGSQWLRDLSGKQHHLKLGSTGRAEILDGALLLGGSTGNLALTADAAALDIVGDIDVRVAVAVDDWTPAAAPTFISKYNTTGNQRSWIFYLDTTGKLGWLWTTDGITPIAVLSTVAPTIADGSMLLVRVAFDVNNGAAGNDALFYTKVATPATAAVELASDLGWTQLGTTVTTATATSIFASTQQVEIGTHSGGVTAPLAGKVYAACVKNGIDGATALSPNFNGQNDGTVAFDDAQGNHWKLPYSKVQDRAVHLTGVVANYVTTPDAAIHDITGDIDMRAVIAPDDWTPGTTTIIAKAASATTVSYMFSLIAGGFLRTITSPDGLNATRVITQSTAAPVIADGQLLAVRATIDVDNGAVGNTVTFYTKATTPQTAHADCTSDAGWVQLGAPVVNALPTSIFASTSLVQIGENQTGSLLTGRVYSACVKNGIAGAITMAPDFTSLVDGTSSFVDSAGSVWTVLATNQGTDTNDPKFLKYDGTRYIWFPGISGNALSVPDSAELSITEDITLEWDGAPDDATPSAAMALVAKWTTNGRTYLLRLGTTGTLEFFISNDGIATASVASSATLPIADGQRVRVRGCRTKVTGGVRFWYSTNLGASWTELGTEQILSANVAMADTTELVRIGATETGNTSNLFTGKVYGAWIYASNIGSGSGTPVLDINTLAATSESAMFTALTGQTVTIGRAATGRKAVVVVRDTFLFGTDDYLIHPDHIDFDATAPDSFTSSIAYRRYGASTAYESLFCKFNIAALTGWAVATQLDTTANRVGIEFRDGGTNVKSVKDSYVEGQLSALTGKRDVAADIGQIQLDQTAGASAVDASTGSLNTTDPMLVGARNVTPTNFGHLEFHAASFIKGEALTVAEIEQLAKELVA